MASLRIDCVLAALIVLTSAPVVAAAAADNGDLISQLRSCRTIADGDARVACYDAIRLGNADPAPPPPSDSAAAPPTTLGSNQLPQPREAKPNRPDRIAATVSDAVEREPGVYLLTIDDGSQWRFVDAVPLSYSPPRQGSHIEIERAALGSYLLHYDRQRAVRIRRVR